MSKEAKESKVGSVAGAPPPSYTRHRSAEMLRRKASRPPTYKRRHSHHDEEVAEGGDEVGEEVAVKAAGGLVRRSSRQSRGDGGRSLHRIPTGTTKSRDMPIRESSKTHGSRRSLAHASSLVSLGVEPAAVERALSDMSSEASVELYEDFEGGRRGAGRSRGGASGAEGTHRRRSDHGRGMAHKSKSSRAVDRVGANGGVTSSRGGEGSAARRAVLEHRPSSRLTKLLAATKSSANMAVAHAAPGASEVPEATGAAAGETAGGTVSASAAGGAAAQRALQGDTSPRVRRPAIASVVTDALGPEPKIAGIMGDHVRAGDVAVQRGLATGLPASISLPGNMLLTYFPAGSAPAVIRNNITHPGEICGADAARVAMHAMRKRGGPDTVFSVPTLEGGIVTLFPKQSFPRPDSSALDAVLPEPEDMLSGTEEERKEAKVAPGDDLICCSIV
jgi:hypothetical protein